MDTFNLYDQILVDFALSGSTGDEIIREIRGRKIFTDIVFYSSNYQSMIINLDITKKYVLCFGDDACCKANLAFMIENLKAKGYSQPIQVQILNEYNLELQKEYFI